MLAAYWEIGTGIIAREDREGWGAKVIERLAADLRREPLRSSAQRFARALDDGAEKTRALELVTAA